MWVGGRLICLQFIYLSVHVEALSSKQIELTVKVEYLASDLNLNRHLYQR